MNKDNFLRFIITGINRLIACAVAEKVSAIATEDYLQRRPQHADKQAFERLSAKVSNREAIPGDEL
jgi:hypothetical protein